MKLAGRSIGAHPPLCCRRSRGVGAPPGDAGAEAVAKADAEAYEKRMRMPQPMLRPLPPAAPYPFPSAAWSAFQ
jgi:hypothetical protein